MSALTRNEKRRLATLERVVADGLAVCFQVGSALAEIRDTRLYRETHATFEAYVASKWCYSRQRAYQLIDAADIAHECSQSGVPIDNEAQARSLRKIPKQHRHQVIELAKQAGRVTAKSLDDAAAALFPPVDTQRKTSDEREQKASQSQEPTVTCPCCNGQGHVAALPDMPNALRSSEAFVAKWAEWLRYHRERQRRSLPRTTIEKQWKQLDKMGVVDAIASLEQSMSSGWQGVFPVRSNNNAKRTNTQDHMVYKGD